MSGAGSRIGNTPLIFNSIPLDREKCIRCGDGRNELSLVTVFILGLTMTPSRISNQEKAEGMKLTLAMLWKFATAIAVLCFPVAMAVGGYFAGKVLDHDKQIAVVQASYTTRDETESRSNGLKQSIDSLKETINDLKVEIVKIKVEIVKIADKSGK